MQSAERCEYVWSLPCVTRIPLAGEQRWSPWRLERGIKYDFKPFGMFAYVVESKLYCKRDYLKICRPGQKLLFFFNSAKWRWKSFSRVWLFAIPWSGACQASLSMRFPRQESWSGLPFPSPGDGTWVSWTAGRFFTIWATAFNSTYIFVFL